MTKPDEACGVSGVPAQAAQACEGVIAWAIPRDAVVVVLVMAGA